MDCYYNGKDKLLDWIDSSWNKLLYNKRSMSLVAIKKQDMIATNIIIVEYYA